MGTSIIPARLRGFLSSIRQAFTLPSNGVASDLEDEVRSLGTLVAAFASDPKALTDRESVFNLTAEMITGLHRILEGTARMMSIDEQVARTAARFRAWFAVLIVAMIAAVCGAGWLGYSQGAGDLSRVKGDAQMNVLQVMMRGCAEQGFFLYKDTEGRTVRVRCYLPEGSTWADRKGKPPIIEPPIKKKPLDGNKT